MSENSQALAIVALFTVGIFLLNYGADMVRQGDLYNGLAAIIFGVGLIFAAVLITKLMVKGIVEAFAPSPTPP